MEAFKQTLLKHGLKGEKVDQMAAYAELLLKKNAVLNLTRVTEPQQMAEKLFLDSITVVKAGLIKDMDTVLDVGTGSGFPGIPIAIMLKAPVTLLDATGKKIEFVKEAAEKIGLHVHCISARAEELAHDPNYREQFDVVVAKAVAHLSILAELAFPFAKIGGRLLAYKGKVADEEKLQSAPAVEKMGGIFLKAHQNLLPGTDHVILEYQKKAQTPEEFPRRYSLIKSKPFANHN